MIATASKPNIGLTADHQEGIVEILNATLSDLHVLYVKTRNYHWNVTGPQFLELHRFFQTQYDELAESVDEVAERVRSFGGNPLGTMTEYVRQARLKEHPGQYPDARAMVEDLLADHETTIRSLRVDLDRCAKQYHDMGTSDFLTLLMQKHEKTAWMLRALLEGKPL
jgi:starvation-inducible DNA-binding protein